MTPLRDGLQRFYEEMGELRERSLDKLGDHFSEDIHFRDPFRDTYGLHMLRGLFVTWFQQYKQVKFTGFRATGDDVNFTLRYDMHMRMAVGPWFGASMVSVCEARDGKVIDLDDYYDFAGCIVSPWPVMRRGYRGLVNALFL